MGEIMKNPRIAISVIGTLLITGGAAGLWLYETARQAQESAKPALNNSEPAKAKEEDRELKIEFASEEMKRLAELSPSKTAPKKKSAAKMGVYIGMTPSQVLDSSWGKPKRINRTTNRSGTREQWVYGSGNYLNFENDLLTSIQN